MPSREDAVDLAKKAEIFLEEIKGYLISLGYELDI
jgi:hypothetical protein